MLNTIFTNEICKLPKADIKLEGVTAYLSQGDNHQILFMYFEKDAIVPDHFHSAQVSFVLEGMIDIISEGNQRTYVKGDRICIKEGEMHSARIYSGYADITFFNQKDRYKAIQ